MDTRICSSISFITGWTIIFSYIYISLTPVINSLCELYFSFNFSRCTMKYIVSQDISSHIH